MSTKNLHPPQTYSRLFRPWDTTRNAPTSYSCPNPTTTPPPHVKREYEGPSMSTSTTTTATTETTPPMHIKSEETSYTSGNDSDRECASSSSCKSSHDDALNDNFNRETTTPILDVGSPLTGSSTSSSHAPDAYSDVNSLYPQLPQHHQPHQLLHHPSTSSPAQQQMPPFMSPGSELYYAAAVAASGMNCGLPGAATFGVDPYALGLMEQEYARVVAEDAHLKALNARKQRPKKFKCPHCDVAFSNNGQLKGHIRIHTGERPFKCDVEICGKTFTRNEELTRHKRIHTGLRPYPCTACGKKFGRRDHLKKHMKTHMPQERSLGPAIFVPMYPYVYGY